MIAVTGATGHLGRLVIEELLGRGIAANRIVALARSPERAADLAGRGVEVRRADYTEPETWAPALAGVKQLLFISASEIGQRTAQHRNVLAAAREAADLELLVYTSLLKAATSGLMLAEEHRATEAMIDESGIPAVVLRNGWYVENYTEHMAPALEHGVLLGSADGGRVSAATRADYAAAAAAVLTTGGHAGKIYELGGDEAFTLAELAAEISRQSERPVEYRDLPEAEFVAALVGAGVPEGFAQFLADSDRGIARGDLYTTSDDLRRLIGRPTTPWREVVAAAVAAVRGG